MLKSLKPGKSMKFITIPNNNDPDSFLENNKREDFFDLKSSSKDLSLLIWDIIEDSISSNTPEFLAVIDDKINQKQKNTSKLIDDKTLSSKLLLLNVLETSKITMLFENT